MGKGVKKCMRGVRPYTDTDGVERWRVDTRVRMPDGQVRRMIKTAIPTREQAEKIVHKAKVEAFEGRWFGGTGASQTVAKVWKTYEPITLRDNDSGRDDVGRAKHLIEHLGTRRAEALTQKDVDEYVTKRLSETTPRGGPPSQATIFKELSLLRRMLNRAAKRGELRVNPLAGMEVEKGDNPRREVLAEADFARLLEAAEAALKPILLVAYDTGMRRREILDLKWSRVDLTRGEINLRPEDTKTGQPRLVVLTERTRETLRATPRSLSGFVFPNPETGQPWNDIRKMWRRACEGAGIEGLWLHDLRRSFITNARRRGVAESVVMRMSGHRTRAVFDRYNVVNDDDLRAGLDRIEKGRRAELAKARASQNGKKVERG